MRVRRPATGELARFRADLARYDDELGDGWGRRLLGVLETQGIWALAMYRFGRWVYTGAPWLARLPLKVVYHLGQKTVEIATGIQLPASCDIGPGLLILHSGSIIIHTDVRMGRGCTIGHDTTLGTRGRGRPGAPVLGDDVYVGAGARILGPVHLGDGAAVGANAVVLSDVPPGATVVGIPAHLTAGRRHQRVAERATASPPSGNGGRPAPGPQL
jgi:serine O-acetyltransferase